MSFKKIARAMVFHQLLYHPWPWKIESDWTEEITASDGFIVAKTDKAIALEIVALAKEMHESIEKQKEMIYS